jgi:hypothetical protein
VRVVDADQSRVVTGQVRRQLKERVDRRVEPGRLVRHLWVGAQHLIGEAGRADPRVRRFVVRQLHDCALKQLTGDPERKSRLEL